MRTLALLLFTVACAPKTPDVTEAIAPAAASSTADDGAYGIVGGVVPNDAAHFGAPFTVEAVLPAADLLADPAAYVGQTVRVEGRVADVCQQAGCWMVLAEGDKSIRVMMKDHAFAVDKGGTGAIADIEGEVVETPIDPATVEHLASESQNPDVMPEKGAEGSIFELVASGVTLRRG